MYTPLSEYARMAGPGLILEFGVSSGGSIRSIAEAVPERVVFGFDSFQGLPEDWCEPDGRVVHPKGQYASAVPDVPSNVHLIAGLFQDTLPQFLAGHPQAVALAHIDCDLYSSTAYVLKTLRGRLDRAILVFDEYEGFAEYDHHEKRAFADFLAVAGYREHYLGRQHPHGGAYRLTATIM